MAINLYIGYDGYEIGNIYQLSLKEDRIHFITQLRNNQLLKKGCDHPQIGLRELDENQQSHSSQSYHSQTSLKDKNQKENQNNSPRINNQETNQLDKDQIEEIKHEEDNKLDNNQKDDTKSPNLMDLNKSSDLDNKEEQDSSSHNESESDQDQEPQYSFYNEFTHNFVLSHTEEELISSLTDSVRDYDHPYMKLYIDELPIVKYDQYIHNNYDGCPITCDDFHDGDEIKILPCNHYFSVDGISSWLKHKTNCPVCRYDLMKVFRE